MLNNYLKALLNKLPSSCIFCDNPGVADKDICEYCLERLPKNTPSCYRCGQFLEQSSDSQLCGYCQSNPPAFDYCHAPFIYQSVTRYLISTLKFNYQYKNARLLGQLFAESVPKTTLPQCIVPVPLHKNRYRQRGFNQSLEIAKTVSKNLKIPIDNSLCIRHKDTPHQIGLAIKQRRKNIKNAFSIIKPCHYSHIAIFDDVMTTGSTLREMAVVLKKAGIETVEVWVCARA